MAVRRVRVGIVCPYSFDHPGGVQAHVLELAAELIARGHSVRVLGPAGPDTPLPGYVTRGGPAIPVRYNGSVARLSFGPRVSKTVRRFLTDGQFDVLHIHEPNSPSYSMSALFHATGPIVATYHASADQSRVLKMVQPVLRPYLEKIRGGIAVSEMARRWQVEQLGGDPVLIPNGVRTDRFRQARRDAVRSGDGGSDRVPEIVFLGRLDEPRKGLDVLLDALLRLSTPVRVTVIGAGAQRPAPGVTYVGRVSDEDKARILGRADIYVAPNRGGESFGIVLVEAMAAGCAVVASDLEAFAAVVNASGMHPAGALFRNGDARDLASVLSNLLENPSARMRLARAGEKRADQYDWAVVASQILAVYEAVIGEEKVGVD